MKYELGQTVFFVPRNNRGLGEAREVTVTRIGKKWVELDNGRFSVAKGETDVKPQSKGYSSPGIIYVSRAVYEAGVARYKAWHELKGSMSGFSVPEGVTIEDIEAAKKLLKIG